MLETLMNLVRQQAGDAIVTNPAIPNEKNDTAIETVTDSILGGLQQQAQGGNIGGLLSSIMGAQGGGLNMQNPLMGGIVNNVVGNLMGRLGVSQSVATGIASALVPVVLNKLFSKATDPNDSSVDVGSIMGQVTGNQAAANVDWMGMASTAMADGKLDMSDVMRVAGGFLGGGSGNQQAGGGLGGMLGGLFGK
ncbi:hypothetical protein [Rudanella lutea]|uniref:hypothetical protein n=1 Tax=Rudanella lutea TaxID=451374 RepID=UPI000480EB11|nr:hypothetical protein [Rudanella lutea]